MDENSQGMIYQVPIDLLGMGFIESHARKCRWPRATALVDIVERYLPQVTAEDVALQRRRGYAHMLTNAECSSSLSDALKEKQYRFECSQAVLVRACIARAMTEVDYAGGR